MQYRYCKNTELQNQLYFNVLQYRSVVAPEDSDSDEEGDGLGRGARARSAICYDEDAVTEKQWLKAVDNNEDLDSVVASKVAKKHGAGRKHIAEVKGAATNKKAAEKTAAAAKKPGSVSLNNMLMQLRKVCNHPYLFEEIDPHAETGMTDQGIVEASGKMKLLDRLLPKLHAGGHRVLIFS